VSNIDYSKWDKIDGALGPKKSKSGKAKAPPILKLYSKDDKTPKKDRVIFESVKEALDICYPKKACKGVTENYKGRVTLRTSSDILPNTKKKWKSWIKK